MRFRFRIQTEADQVEQALGRMVRSAQLRIAENLSKVFFRAAESFFFGISRAKTCFSYERTSCEIRRRVVPGRSRVAGNGYKLTFSFVEIGGVEVGCGNLISSVGANDRRGVGCGDGGNMLAF